MFITDSEGLHTLLAFGISNQGASGAVHVNSAVSRKGLRPVIFPRLERAWPWLLLPAWQQPWLAFAAMREARGSLPAWRHGIGYACFCGHWFLAWNRAPLSLQNRNNLLVSVYILTEKTETTRGKPKS